ncbi:MAG: ThiF family adenylyltransferase [Anaerolineae bacterium]|nr:ThiF family adenylyltransferase [Anaerolineae bacterium]
MSSPLIELNEDLKALREKGYNIDIHGAYLIVRDIPYYNQAKEIKRDGILITELTLNGDQTTAPKRHQMRFVGECPCDAQGNRLEAIRPSDDTHRISEKLTANIEFSNKPAAGYPNHFVKVQNYAALISGPTGISPMSFTVVEPEPDESPFNYLDTASAGAGISMVTEKLTVEKLAIVGIGGTGSYVLDLLAKTPVKEIHLFDGGKFSSHNAFRAPGAPAIEELRTQPHKVDYFHGIYSKMHRGIVAHAEHVDESNVGLLLDMSAVFLCMDAGPGKRLIVETLNGTGVPFFDASMGLFEKEETLGGVVQLTTSTSKNRDQAKGRMNLADTDAPNDYDRNIQVADLNALAAQLAVLRWKKMRGFYLGRERANYYAFSVARSQLLREDIYDEGE